MRGKIETEALYSLFSTVGKIIFNNVMPEYMPFIFNNSDEALDNNCKQYFVKPGSNIKEIIQNLEINDPFTKKSIAKVIRMFFEKYVANTSLRQVALAIRTLDNKTGQSLAKLEKRFIEIPSLTPNKTISKHHAKILAKLVFNQYKIALKKIELDNAKNHSVVDGEIRELEKEEKIRLIESVWFNYTNQVASVLDKIKELGFKYSTISGITISYSDVISADNKKENTPQAKANQKR